MKTIIFDFDGVIVDSNQIKAKAIKKALEDLGIKNDKFVKFFIENGGINRKVKIGMFFKEVDEILYNYEQNLIKFYFNAEFTEGFEEFIDKVKEKELYIISGGAKNEIEIILKNRGFLQYFKEVLGGDRSKIEHIKNLKIDYKDSCFIGDSLVDYESAKYFNIKFIFMYGYTHFKEYKEYFKDKNVSLIKNFREMLEKNVCMD